jgi:hypothetical protein
MYIAIIGKPGFFTDSSDMFRELATKHPQAVIEYVNSE